MAPKSSKTSFTREFKFKAIHYYFGNGKNVNQASNNFKVDKKLDEKWRADKETKTDFTINTAWECNVSYNGERIVQKIYRCKKKGKRIKRWWFNTQAKWIMSETYPERDETFKMSARWFAGFCRRNKYRYKVKPMYHKNLPNNFISQYPNFTQNIERKRRRGTYTSRNLDSMDQTPLPFVLEW